MTHQAAIQSSWPVTPHHPQMIYTWNYSLWATGVPPPHSHSFCSLGSSSVPASDLPLSAASPAFSGLTISYPSYTSSSIMETTLLFSGFYSTCPLNILLPVLLNPPLLTLSFKGLTMSTDTKVSTRYSFLPRSGLTISHFHLPDKVPCPNVTHGLL